MKTVWFVYTLIAIGMAHASERADDENQFLKAIQHFVEKRQKQIVSHVTKAQISLEKCKKKLDRGELESKNKGFYFIEQTKSGDNTTEIGKIVLAHEYQPTLDELLGFDEQNIKIVFDSKDTKHKRKSSIGFFEDFKTAHKGDFSFFQTLFLARVFAQIKTSYRAHKTDESKTEKVNRAFAVVLANLKNDYDAVSKKNASLADLNPTMSIPPATQSQNRSEAQQKMRKRAASFLFGPQATEKAQHSRRRSNSFADYSGKIK